MLYGNGVTKNFLTILQTELDRTGRRLVRLEILALVVAGLAALFFAPDLAIGLSALAGVLGVSVALGLLYAHLVTIRRYNASIKENWNKWMRFSIGCDTVTECYRRVHRRRPGPGVLTMGFILALVILAHAMLGLMAVAVDASFVQVMALFALDGALIGFFLGKRILERRWYRQFLAGVEALMREGTLGVWGVY